MKRLIIKLLGLYTEKDLVSFGNYLLGTSREQSVAVQRRGAVHQSDLSNWEYQTKRGADAVE